MHRRGKHCRNIFPTCKPQAIHIKDDTSTPAIVSNKTTSKIPRNLIHFSNLKKAQESKDQGQTDIHFLKRYPSIPFYVNILTDEYRKSKQAYLIFCF